MIILISPENDIKDEHVILHQLFENGLQYYHLRKPSKSEEEYRNYLNAIDKQFYNRIVTHQYHHLAKEYGLKGVHLQEQFRLDLGDELGEYVEALTAKSQKPKATSRERIESSEKQSTNNQQPTTNNYSVSSSFHHPNDIKNCKVDFDYYLLSPVFNSISKQGYEGKGFSVNDIDKIIVGMGGVTVNNLNEIKAKGYKGAGVLGGVWNANNPVVAFDKILQT